MLLSFTALLLLPLSVTSRVVNYNFDVGNAVLSPDGFPRSTVVVNGQYPGTLIRANKGDTLQVC